jgi:hypothetical protein
LYTNLTPPVKYSKGLIIPFYMLYLGILITVVYFNVSDEKRPPQYSRGQAAPFFFSGSLKGFLFDAVGALTHVFVVVDWSNTVLFEIKL